MFQNQFLIHHLNIPQYFIYMKEKKIKIESPDIKPY
jgi:hypothetical protein